MNAELKRFLEAKKTNPRLVGDVERHLLSRAPEPRSTTVLHPSEIVKKDWCLRASYFALTGVPVKKETPNLRLQSIFDEGHYIHAKWQNWFREMGVLYGQWHCMVCGGEMFATSPVVCLNCGARSLFLKYEEVTLSDAPSRIQGHTDGWIKGIGNDCLIEIKSIGAGTLRFEAPELLAKHEGDVQKAWRSIKRPFNTHLLQGQIYLELMRRMLQPVDEIVFIYELKADQDYSEFTIKADFGMVEEIFEKAKTVCAAVDAKEPLECNIGGKFGCKSCQQFGGENVA
jgi:hypothetical protein